MTLNSALEDLRDTTLRAVSGTLRKLEYLAELRGQAGEYRHWGLAQVHGEWAATQAFQQMHQSLLATVLSTPLKQLVRDLAQSSHSAGISGEEFIERLRSAGPHLLAGTPDPGSARHLNSVLHALSLLAKNQKAAAIHRAS